MRSILTKEMLEYIIFIEFLTVSCLQSILSGLALLDTRHNGAQPSQSFDVIQKTKNNNYLLTKEQPYAWLCRSQLHTLYQ